MLKSMDQNKFLYDIKRVIVIFLMLIATNSFTVAQTTIGPPSAVSPPPKNKPKMNLPMAMLLVGLLFAFLLICFFIFYFRRYTERQLALAAATRYGGERSSMELEAACGLDPAVIATFTCFMYSTVKEIKIGRQVLECAVCLNEFHDHETLRLLPECNHVFHRECIDGWLALHVTCPVCRASLVPKPSQLSQKTELPICDVNKQTKDHVSVEVSTSKHDLAHPRKLCRSYSMGHPVVERVIENADRYTLRLPDEVKDFLKHTVIETDVSLLQESSLKKSLKSASANFIRGSSYFDYERFGHERRCGGQNLAITGSFVSRSSSGSGSSSRGDVEDSTATSKRFLTSVRSPFNRLFQLGNKNTDVMVRLNDC